MPVYREYRNIGRSPGVGPGVGLKNRITASFGNQTPCVHIVSKLPVRRVSIQLSTTINTEA
jgi:hypothetical protein